MPTQRITVCRLSLLGCTSRSLCGAERRFKCHDSPYPGLLGIIEDPLRRHEVRHLHFLTALYILERRQAKTDKRANRLLIRLQIQHVIRNQGKHQAIVVNAKTSKHSPRSNSAEQRKYFLQIFDECAHLIPW